MSMSYFIVESPNKVKKISQIIHKLKIDAKVVATVGHIRDLPLKSLGFEISNKQVYISYENCMKKGFSDFVKKIKKKSTIYLATDPDREGEAIAWHIIQCLGDIHLYYRVRFNSITPSEIQKAYSEKTSIDMNLVYSQQSRRVLDRMVGYMISPICQSKIKCPSAGRVQSVVLKLIYDRCLEILNFVSDKYYTIHGFFDGTEYLYRDTHIQKENINSIYNVVYKTMNQMYKKECELKVVDVYPHKPYKTSTIQVDACNKYRMSPNVTMMHLQQLFESGYITYHRTDSEEISCLGISQIKDYVIKKYDDSYSKPRHFQKSGCPHECIRPTNMHLEVLGDRISPDAIKIYKDIHQRTVCSQMIEGHDWLLCETMVYNGIYFDKTTRCKKSLGFRKHICNELIDDFHWNADDECLFSKLQDIKVCEYDTKSPEYYTTSSLIQKMEKLSIGRPSTYAYVIQKIQTQKICEYKNGKYMYTDRLKEYVLFLEKYFGDNFMNVLFTQEMEKSLDDICENKVSWNIFLSDYYELLQKKIKETL